MPILRVLLHIFRESFLIALQELNSNKLRALLSLSGITIGILCIISVFAAVDSLERNIRNSLSGMGDGILFIEKWPWTFGSNYPWWRYVNRPEANFEDYRNLSRQMENAESVAYQVAFTDRTVKYKNRFAEDALAVGITHSWNGIYDIRLVHGRYFSQPESTSGSAVAVIGYEIAEALFLDPEQALGKPIQILNRKVTVIGVIEKEGQGIVSTNLDASVLLPFGFVSFMLSEKSRMVGQRALVKVKDGITMGEARDEVTKVMRRSRKLRPKQEDNFAINEMSVLSQGITQTFSLINFAGMLIGGFSILVGGFGIANIMFVSVKERTRYIGIKMSLGARKIFILFEFLIESVVLCLIGGILGLIMVYGLFQAASGSVNFDLVLSTGNIILGITISVLIGLVSGIFPAVSASRMDPVDAMRK